MKAERSRDGKEMKASERKSEQNRKGEYFLFFTKAHSPNIRGNQKREKQFVLTHDGSVRLRGEDEPVHLQHLPQLGLGLQRLGDVEIHFVAVEISVVGRRHGQVHPESGPGEHLENGRRGGRKKVINHDENVGSQDAA